MISGTQRKAEQTMKKKGLRWLAILAAVVMIAATLGGRKVRCAFFWPVVILAATVFNPYVFPFFFATLLVLYIY